MTKDAERSMEEVDALRRRVVNVVGHALRGPVTTVRGLAEEIVATPDPDARAVVEEALVRNARMVERLLDDLLALAGVTTALPVEPARPVDVGEAVRRAWSLVADGDASLRLEQRGPDRVVVGPTGFERVLVEVLSNAARYGRGPVAVLVEGGSVPGQVRVVVSSPRGGATEQDIDLAFEPFYRGEHAVMTGNGLGVGLAVARALLDQHGGTILLRATDEQVVCELAVPSP